MATLSPHTGQSGAAGSGAAAVTSAASGAVSGGVSGSVAGGVHVSGSGQPGKGPGRPGGRRGGSLFSRIWGRVWRGLVFLLLLLLFFLAGIFLALRNENVQAWLKDEVNAVLAASAETSGLHVRLTRLSGSLPFSMQVGLELADAQGLWLEAPLNTFEWDWAALPGSVRIRALASHNPRLFRLPDLPPAAPDEPSPPMTEKGLRGVLGEVVQILNTLPGWLPAVRVDRLAVVDAALPQSLLGAALPPAGDPQPQPAPATPSADPAALPPAGDPQPQPASATPSADPAPLVVGTFFRADVEASLKADSKGGSLNLTLTASGRDHGPLLVSDTPCGGLAVRVQADFAPHEDKSGKLTVQSLTVSSSLEASVLPVAAATAANAEGGKPTEAPQTDAAPAVPAAPGPQGASSAQNLQGGSAQGPSSAQGQPATPGQPVAPGQQGSLAPLLADGARLSLALEAQVQAHSSALGAMASTARAALTTFDLKAGPLSGTGHALWHSPDAVGGTSAPRPGNLGPVQAPVAAPAASQDQAPVVAPATAQDQAPAMPQGQSSATPPVGSQDQPQGPAQGTIQDFSWLSGPLDVDLRLSLTPPENSATRVAANSATNTATSDAADPLRMLAAPATLQLTAVGPLEAPGLNLRLECADLRLGSHKLEKAVASLAANPLNWRQALLLAEELESTAPAKSTEQAAASQLALQLDVSGQWDSRPLSLGTQIFAGRTEGGMLQAGLRQLRLSALGVEAAGQVAAILPPGSMPGCDGKLDVRVSDWAALSSLVPGARLNGEAAVSLELRSERMAVPAAPKAAEAHNAATQQKISQNNGQSPAPVNSEATPAQGDASPTTATTSATATTATTSATATTATTSATATTAATAKTTATAGSEATAATPATTATAGAEATGSPAARFSQQAVLRWNIPRLSYSAGAGAPLTLQNLAGEATLRDLFGAANLAARLDLAALRQGDLSLGTKVRVNGSLHGPLDASVETSGSVAARVNARWQPGLVQVQTFEASLAGHDLGFKTNPGASLRYGDSGMSLSGLDMRLIPGGRLRANAALEQNKLDARLDLNDLALTPWKKLIPALPEGTVEARARLTGSPSRPGGDVHLGVRQLRIPGSPLKPLNLGLTGRIEGENLVARLSVDKESIEALGGTEARLEARLPLVFSADGPPQPNMQGPLRGQVRWKGAAGPLWSLLPVADQRFAGNVDISVDLGGTLSAPSAKGSVLIDKGKYENLLQGVLLTNINLRLKLEEGRGKGAGSLPGVARLELDATGGLGGKLRVAGYSSLDGSKMDIKTTIDHLRPLSRRDIRIELSGDVGVTGSAAAPKVDGMITVNQGLVQLNKLAVGGSVTTLPISESPEPAPTQPAPAQSGTKQTVTKQSASVHAAASSKPEAKGSLNLRIVIPGRFLVEGHGLSSEWKADLLVAGTPEDPQITGQIMAVKGSFDFLGKIFTLSRGTVTFAGGSLSNPLLDIKLANETPNLTSYVSITGTVRKMKLSLSSEPELPRDEILAQILFGKSTNELGRLENLRLAAAVAQLAGFGSSGGGIFDVTRKALGVDVLRLSSTPGSGSGEGSDEGMGEGTAVEMGKYITDIIYVGVQQGMKQGSTAFIIQLELTPRTNLELRSEQQSTWGGIRWKYNY